MDHIQSQRTNASSGGSHYWHIILGSGMALITVAGIVFWQMATAAPQPAISKVPPVVAPAPKPSNTFMDLLQLDKKELAHMDIARMNLLCAVGLPGSEKLDVAASLHQLDVWAARIATETTRYFSEFTKKPEDFNNSEGYFRILMMITVLQQDLGVHYNLERVNKPDFSHAQDIFINGMIGSNNGGTCSSMPALYTAIARRLGYPVFLVKAKEHLFCRWDGFWQGKPDRFNIEGSGQGGNTFPDDYYRTWPHPISQAEADRGEHLRSLSPMETLALCLAQRGYVLEASGDAVGASVMYAEAANRDSYDRMYPTLAEHAADLARPKPKRFISQIPYDVEDINAMNRRAIERGMPTHPNYAAPQTPTKADGRTR